MWRHQLPISSLSDERSTSAGSQHLCAAVSVSEVWHRHAGSRQEVANLGIHGLATVVATSELQDPCTLLLRVPDGQWLRDVGLGQNKASQQWRQLFHTEVAGGDVRDQRLTSCLQAPAPQSSRLLIWIAPSM